MAESYPSFQGREPNIDISLFGDAATQGTNIGKAIPGKIDAIATGALEGYKEGVAIQATQANTAAQEAANAVNTDPAVIQAKKDAAIAQAEILQADAAAAKANGDIERKAKVAEAKLKARVATEKLNELNTIDAINTALDDPNTTSVQLEDMLGKSRKALNSNSDAAQQILARTRGRISDASQKQWESSTDAVLIEKKRVEMAQARERAIQTQALNRDEDIQKATATIQTSSTKVAERMLDTSTYNPSKLDFIKAADYEEDPATGGPKFDSITKQPILDTKKRASDKLDTRVFAIYDGETLDTLSSTAGEAAIKALPDYRLKYAAIYKDKADKDKPTPDKPTPTTFESKGLGADTQTATSSANKLTPPASSLEGKTPEQQRQYIDVFNRKVAQMKSIPRPYRDVVLKIESDPVFKGESPVLKALASVESVGNNAAVSPVTRDSQGNKMGGVSGLMQITGDTWDGLVKNYPTAMQGADKSTPEGQVKGAKTLLLELHKQFQGDLPLIYAAYNAGAPVIASAVADTRKQGETVTWANVKKNLSKYVSPEKFKEVENYPEMVMKYQSYYA